MANITESLVKQRRFQRLFIGLLILSLFLGLLIVPVELTSPQATINTLYNGIWWAVTTVTSVGYGDMVPVTNLGKLIGMILQIMGVLAFGLLVSLVTVALDDAKERYFRQRLEERLEMIDKRLEKMEKQQNFVVREQIENGQE